MKLDEITERHYRLLFRAWDHGINLVRLDGNPEYPAYERNDEHQVWRTIHLDNPQASEYDVRLISNSSGIHHTCTCHAGMHDGLCKHVALLLHISQLMPDVSRDDPKPEPEPEPEPVKRLAHLFIDDEDERDG